MSYLYKLTDEYGRSGLSQFSSPLKWGEGVKHEIQPSLRNKLKQLCTNSYIHAYENPLVAVFMNPAHANFQNPILWKATGWVSKRDGQLKCGCFSLTTHEKLPLPVISTTQRVRITIHCALLVYRDENFVNWASNWLSGQDRTKKSAAADADADAQKINKTSFDLISLIKRSMKEEPA